MGHSGQSWTKRHAEWRFKHRQAEQAQQVADRLCVEAWNERLMQLGGPLQPSPSLRAAINGGYAWLRVECNACKQYAWVDRRKVRRPPGTWIWQLEASLVCEHCRRGSRYAPRARIEMLCQHEHQLGALRHQDRD
jgi:hypothetical protein